MTARNTLRHATARIAMHPSGVRQGPIPPPHHGCVFHSSESYHECRMLLSDPIDPGTSAEIGLVFLWPELVVPRLQPGLSFELCVGSRPFATGTILSIDG